MTALIRLATEADAEGIRAIYAPIVAHTAISFETEPPSAAEMRARIARALRHRPWLVCERDGDILGYAYAGEHRERAAYRWCADVSVYVHERARRAGVGRALYSSLFRLLTLQGYHNAYAGITLPNPASVGLHESLGFRPVGVYRSVGYKLGAWHDVGWWQLALRERSADPPPPLDLRSLRDGREWEAALAAGTALLRL